MSRRRRVPVQGQAWAGMPRRAVEGGCRFFRFAYAVVLRLLPPACRGSQSGQMPPGLAGVMKGDDVTSALACVGLAVSDETELRQLVTRAHQAVRETGVFDGVHAGRWEDDSGAALVLGWRSGELVDF